MDLIVSCCDVKSKEKGRRRLRVRNISKFQQPHPFLIKRNKLALVRFTAKKKGPGRSEISSEWDPCGEGAKAKGDGIRGNMLALFEYL
jgi:hypothetical protein